MRCMVSSTSAMIGGSGLEVDHDRAVPAAAGSVGLDVVVAEDDEGTGAHQLAGGAAPASVEDLVGGDRHAEARVTDGPALFIDRFLGDDVGGVAVVGIEHASRQCRAVDLPRADGRGRADTGEVQPEAP